MKKLSNKIFIHPLTYLVLLISFFASFFEYMFLLLFIITIHELGHLITISFLGYKISKIIIFPFGGLTEYDSKINENILKEILICISGPIVQILFIFIIVNLNEYILPSTYTKFLLINKYLLMFNLLPIYPLDGGKLLNLILDYMISYKKSMYLVFSISLIIVIYFLFKYMFINKDVLVFILFLFTLKSVINEMKKSKEKFNKFLLERYLYNFNYKQGNCINSINNLKRNKTHKIIKDNFVYDEKNYLKKYIFNI